MPKILSVDDSGIMRKIIRGAVERLGYEFLEAEDGEKALNVMDTHHADVVLILLDWNMPVKDGYETLIALKQDTRFTHVPIMMVTTEGEKTNIIKAIQAGAKHYVIKPFTQEDLTSRMVECLGMHVG